MPHLRFSRRAIRLLDLAVALWLAAWLVIAAMTYRDVRALADFADSADAAGAGLVATADALSGLRDVPFVGDDLERLEQRIRTGARRTTRTAALARDEIRAYGARIGAALALAPTLPVLLVHGTLRVGWSRDRRRIRQALRRADPCLAPYLARRALASVDLSTFARTTVNGEPHEEGVAELAARELARLGLAPRR